VDLANDKFFDAFRSAATSARSSGRLPAFLGEIERLKAEVMLDAARPVLVPEPPKSEEDAVLNLREAAEFMGEPVETFRRRPEYLKACLRRPGERRLRYSRAALGRIKADRLAGNSVE
jgi:hypothetical protein